MPGRGAPPGRARGGPPGRAPGRDGGAPPRPPVPGGGGMGLPVDEVGGRAGGGMALPVSDAGGAPAAAGAAEAAGAAGAAGRWRGRRAPARWRAGSAGRGAVPRDGSGRCCRSSARRAWGRRRAEPRARGPRRHLGGRGGLDLGGRSGLRGLDDLGGGSLGLGRGGRAPARASAFSALGSAFFLGGAFLVLTGGFLGLASSTGLASSAGAAFTRPSFCARRRTRSPWASTMLEEWLRAPIPSLSQRSRTSWLLIPSSRASS